MPTSWNMEVAFHDIHSKYAMRNFFFLLLTTGKGKKEIIMAAYQKSHQIALLIYSFVC